MKKSTIVILYCCLLLSITNCSHNTVNKQMITVSNRIDSIIVWYHKEKNKTGEIVLEERFGSRDEFMLYDANASLTISDSSELILLSDLISNLRPRDQEYVGESVWTKCALVVYRSNSSDTLALSCVPPPEVQTKNEKYIDCISKDSLLCKTIWTLIAQTDSFWLNECHDGAWYEYWR